MIAEPSKPLRIACALALAAAALPQVAAAATAGAEVSVQGDPEELVVSGDELPTSFGIVGGDHEGDNRYNAVYFNPQALLAEGSGDHGLLGVIINLAILDSSDSAISEFVSQGGLDAESVLRQIGDGSSGKATPLGAEEYPTMVAGADRVAAFRVQYTLEGTHVYEYRYRVRVGNALANLIISARATEQDGEPSKLRSRTRAIVDRQVARLVAAGG